MTKSTEIGVELSFFKNRLHIDYAYYLSLIHISYWIVNRNHMYDDIDRFNGMLSIKADIAKWRCV